MNKKALIQRLREETAHDLHHETVTLLLEAAEALAQPEQTSAERTLQALGYINNGGEFWKPPLGEVRKAQPEQEPVAWPCLIAEADFSQNTVTLAMQCEDYKVSAGQHWLYTTPPAPPAQPEQDVPEVCFGNMAVQPAQGPELNAAIVQTLLPKLYSIIDRLLDGQDKALVIEARRLLPKGYKNSFEKEKT